MRHGAEVMYVRPHFDSDKEGKKFVDLEFSVPLSGENAPRTPPVVQAAWGIISSSDESIRRIDLDEVPAQTVDAFFIAGAAAFHVAAATVARATLSVIEQKGSGDAVDVIRFHFKLRCEISDDVKRFATDSYGEIVRLVLQDAQIPIPFVGNVPTMPK